MVILESGIAASSLSWALVQPEIARFTRVCSYDRAGLGWSPNSASPRSVPQVVSELAALLSAAALPSPYILVGHSYGALLVRAFSSTFPDAVAGLVLLDPVALRGWADCNDHERRRLHLGVRLSRRGAMLARFGVVRFALSMLTKAGTRFPKLIARTAAGPASQTLDRLVGQVRHLPPQVWPAIRSHWSRPNSFTAMAAYLESLPTSAQCALPMYVPDQIPVIILSASTAKLAELQERDEWVERNTKGRHIRLQNCGHWVQVEQPEAVIAAVSEIVTLCRQSERLSDQIQRGSLHNV